MPDERAQVLYIAPWVDLGGSDKGTIDWFKHLDRERWAPSLITTQPSPNRWLGQVEPFAEEVWALPDLMPGPSFPEFILGFVESRGVRLVHIMNSRLGFDLLPDMACLPQPPAVVVQMHAEEPNQAGYVRYATRRYGNLIDAFSVTSEHLKEIVVGYEIPPSRVEVIHSGVDGKEEFDPERVEPLPLDDTGAPRILWPGRLVEQKDPMLTLDVLARVRQRGGEFVLDVVGDGHLKPAVQARAEELGLADAIRWHPPSQEMPRWYRSADLMLMTSVYEGVPYVIYEALAMGVPVVAPALSGNIELMDADSGVLVEPRDDVERYAEAIVGLLGDRARREALGARSRGRMLAEFSLEEMGRRHDELYELLLASRPASTRWRSDQLFGDGKAEPAAATAAAPTPLKLPRNPPPERAIGVIVPCYRHGIFLDECIASINAQTLPAAQIVVVDDGSDDPETIEALERLDDPEVTLVRLGVNCGPSVARNRGLERLQTSYMLPIDADDRLLPDALERMLAQLEAAPEDVGFVYPHAQHFGNRSDFVQLPAYNLWLLMQENYCPAPALFDLRLFEAGIAYPEDIVVGHEDWDLILQLAERGVRGVHADGPTFLYRRQGFSRVNAVDYGPDAFHESIERRHPSLYGNKDAIKARWAPALSIVLLGGEEEWRGVDLSGLARQSCRDFEVLSGGELQAAIAAARGRWVCLLTPTAAPILESRSFAEQLLYGFVAHEAVAATVLGEEPDPARHAFRQLDDEERLGARPVGVAYERLPAAPLGKIELKGEDPLVDLAIALQAHGSVQWRAVPVAAGAVAGGRGIARDPGPRTGELDVGLDRSADLSELATRETIVHQAPRLPELTAGTVRRWGASEAWIPPGTQPLCRHVQLDGEHRIVSNDPDPPPGYRLEFALGAVHAHAAPGTRRLVQSGHELELIDDQNDLGSSRHAYGYVEQQPLPLLEHLELRRLPETGQQVLVAGAEDPLFAVAEPLQTLGWIEAYPIQPRRDLLHTGPWGVDVLWREVDEVSGRHRYASGPPGDRRGETALGSLFRQPGKGLVALRRRSDGRLASDLAQPGRASRDPRKIGRWVAAPLAAVGTEPLREAAETARVRLRQALHPAARRLGEDDGAELGWLREAGGPGCSPLFSATHPVTGNQLVTPSPHEATDHGYPLEGVLGYILDAGAERAA
jgi:glycosyltransferase involved in cell wall biosynthesis